MVMLACLGLLFLGGKLAAALLRWGYPERFKRRA